MRRITTTTLIRLRSLAAFTYTARDPQSVQVVIALDSGTKVASAL